MKRKLAVSVMFGMLALSLLFTSCSGLNSLFNKNQQGQEQQEDTNKQEPSQEDPPKRSPQ